jgi:hypothetical protein
MSVFAQFVMISALFAELGEAAIAKSSMDLIPSCQIMS